MNSDNIKTPLTRLLDLTAGWAEFVQRDEKNIVDPAVSADELCDLYQAAGLLMGEELLPSEEAWQVRRFVEDRVLPLLLRENLAAAPANTLAEEAAAVSSSAV